MEAISRRLLSASVQRARIKTQVEATEIMNFFARLLIDQWGAKAKTKTKPLSFSDGVLRVAVTSTVMASELRLYEAEFIKKINQRFNSSRIKKIKLEL